MSRDEAPRQDRRHRRRERTRAKLMDAALELFVERGYHKVTLSEVTERADRGAGTLHLHFRDKRSLYEAVARRELLALRGRWVEAARNEPDPREQVLLMIRTAISHFAEHPEQAQLFLVEGPAVEGWIVDEVGRAITALLEGHLADANLASHLLIGTALAAGRWQLRVSSRAARRALIDTTLQYCRGAMAALGNAKRGRRQRSRRARVASGR